MEYLPDILSFMKLTLAFQQVKRAVFVASESGRLENDLEHSSQLALLSWYFCSRFKLPLNSDLVVKYALAHDLVEAYAGDTNIYTKDDSHKSSKADREAIALSKIEKEFPGFKDATDIIHAYEARADEESRFVYALDKVIPVLNIYLDKGYSWKEHNISLSMITEHKKDKVSAHKDVEKCWYELVSILQKEEASLFPSSVSVPTSTER